jgi:hypothetical protein
MVVGCILTAIDCFLEKQLKYTQESIELHFVPPCKEYSSLVN